MRPNMIAAMPVPGRPGVLFACVAGAGFHRLCLTANMIAAMVGPGRPITLFACTGFPRLCLAAGVLWWFDAWKGLGRGADRTRIPYVASPRCQLRCLAGTWGKPGDQHPYVASAC